MEKQGEHNGGNEGILTLRQRDAVLGSACWRMRASLAGKGLKLFAPLELARGDARLIGAMRVEQYISESDEFGGLFHFGDLIVDGEQAYVQYMHKMNQHASHLMMLLPAGGSGSVEALKLCFQALVASGGVAPVLVQNTKASV